MKEFSEAETQLLIAMLELSRAKEPPTPEALAESTSYFRKYLVDWTDAFGRLLEKGLLTEKEGVYALTAHGHTCAEQVRRERPPMWYWYNEYYSETKNSQAHAVFCERLFGKNLCQHGFADMEQLNKLLEVTNLGASNQVLDLGCGNGLIAEYISDVTQAHVTGIDYIPEAIRQARERTRDKQQRLTFQVGNMDHLDFPAGAFDTLISIDTLYMPTDLAETIRQVKTTMKPGGQMAIFYSHGVEPGISKETFPKETLRPDQTPLADALKKHGLTFRTWDFTQEDYRHAQRKKQIAEELKSAFEAEGNLFLYDNRHAEAEGVMDGIESGLHVRYLYHVRLQGAA